MIAASAGNHALALSYHGRDLGIPVTVVMPLNAPIMKISACRKHGAEVHVNGADLIEVGTSYTCCLKTMIVDKDVSVKTQNPQWAKTQGGILEVPA